MALELKTRAYASATAVAAIALLGYALVVWPPQLGREYGGLAVLALLGIAAINFPLRVTARCNIDLSAAVYFAAILLYGPSTTLLLVAVVQLLGEAIRRARRGTLKLRRAAIVILFNTSQLMLANGIGGLVYFGFLGHSLPAPMDRVENVWAMPIAAATTYAVNSAAVAAMVGLEMRERPLQVWLSGRRLDLLQHAGLFLVGLVTALASTRYPWAPIGMVLPAAIIYLSLKRTIQLVQQTIAALEKMADVLDLRDRSTADHSRRVSEYAVAIARRMRLPADEVETIRLAARVHDLGKIGVPDHVLLKDGGLTDEEWEQMKSHVQIGYEILSQFPEYSRGKDLVLSHHERFDGRGYPRGIAGHRVALGAQVIAVADAFDSMTSDRIYRKAMSIEAAVAELLSGKGIQWNPDVVDAFAAHLTERRRPGRRPLRTALA